MKALVTGASSGIGKEMCIYLSKLNFDIIAVARDKNALEKLKEELKTDVQVISMDLSKQENCILLYNTVKEQNIDILINDAGFGTFGRFVDSDLEKELSMINTNISALHILTKLFLIDMNNRGKGYILNVASLAGFMPGPLMASYYASKAYVVRLSQAIRKELKKSGSKTKISILCPGPVATKFNDVAGVRFSMKPLTSEYVAKYTIDKMLKGKFMILPSFSVKISRFMSKLAPDNLVAEVTYHIQKKKEN